MNWSEQIHGEIVKTSGLASHESIDVQEYMTCYRSISYLHLTVTSLIFFRERSTSRGPTMLPHLTPEYLVYNADIPAEIGATKHSGNPRYRLQEALAHFGIHKPFSKVKGDSLKITPIPSRGRCSQSIRSSRIVDW